jgi:hypothetical protein
MKLKLTTIAILLCSLQSFSQAYIPFQFGNTRWAYNEQNPLTTTPYFYFSKDTTGLYVGSNKYWKIEKQLTPTYVPATGVVSYLFDDTASRKVFTYDPTNGVRLRYDFSAGVGSIINGISNDFLGAFDTVMVDSVKTITTNSVARKHVYVHSTKLPFPETKVWIEGIGSTYELMNPTTTLPDPVFKFACLQYNMNTLYADTLGGPNVCSFKTAIDDVLQTNHALIYPNPSSSGVFFIHVAEKISWKIFNIAGKTIAEGNTKRVDISNQTTGMYFLQLKNENNLRTIKVRKS